MDVKYRRTLGILLNLDHSMDCWIHHREKCSCGKNRVIRDCKGLTKKKLPLELAYDVVCELEHPIGCTRHFSKLRGRRGGRRKPRPCTCGKRELQETLANKLFR